MDGSSGSARKQVSKVSGKRADAIARRDTAIVEAALKEFTEKGFAATRLEDIASRAGVGKGTIYLRFPDKQALFEAIIRQQIFPVIEAISAPAVPGESVHAFLSRVMLPLAQDLTTSPRAAVIRMVIAEASRFPNLAAFYFENIVGPGLKRLQTLLRRAARAGELRDPQLARYPQLVIAPLLMAVLWSGLFDRFATLDVAAMVRAHLDHLLPKPSRP